MKRIASFRILGLLLLPFFLLAACDTGGSNGGEIDNEFSFDVSPMSTSPAATAAKSVRDTTISGFSFFFSGQDANNEEVFGIYLNGNESFSAATAQQGLFGFIARHSARPDEGTYDFISPGLGIDTQDFAGVLYEDLGTDGFQDAPFYVPTGGTVTISSSSEDKVVGSVDATANAITFDLSTTPTTVDTTHVSITGQFTARDVDSFVPLTTPPN